MRADLGGVWQRWLQLSAERRRDQGDPLRISIEAMDRYLDEDAVTDAQARRDTKRLWRAMDDAYFEHMGAVREAKASAHAVPGAQR